MEPSLKVIAPETRQESESYHTRDNDLKNDDGSSPIAMKTKTLALSIRNGRATTFPETSPSPISSTKSLVSSFNKLTLKMTLETNKFTPRRY